MWHWTCATSIFYKYYKIKAVWEEQTPVLWRFVDKPATNITTHATQNSNDAFGSRNVCMLYQNIEWILDFQFLNTNNCHGD